MPLAATKNVPVLAFDAEHNEERAAHHRPEEFNQLRSHVHLAVGAPVMLVANQILEHTHCAIGADAWRAKDIDSNLWAS